MSATVCSRQGCGHPIDRHTQADGCTFVLRAIIDAAPGVETIGECPCAAFLASRDTVPAESDDATSHAETHVEALAPVTHAPERAATLLPATSTRRRMSDTRAAKTRVFRLHETNLLGKVVEVKLYFTVGFFDDGSVGEVFLKASQQGATLSGALDAVGIFMSMCLQHNVPLADVIGKIRGMNFPPYGLTGAPDIPTCQSPLDLLARWLMTFLPKETA